jgi:hypothetical protein
MGTCKSSPSLPTAAEAAAATRAGQRAREGQQQAEAARFTRFLEGVAEEARQHVEKHEERVVTVLRDAITEATAAGRYDTWVTVNLPPTTAMARGDTHYRNAAAIAVEQAAWEAIRRRLGEDYVVWESEDIERPQPADHGLGFPVSLRWCNNPGGGPR